MKRIVAVCLCLLLCGALLCGCDTTRGNEVSVDINAVVHTLDEFPKGDFSCDVVYEEGKEKTTGTAAESSADEEEPVVTHFTGQTAVDLYNLLNRSAWKPVKEAAEPTGEYTGMLTLDFYTGKSLEHPTAYYGEFTISNQNRVIISLSPQSLSMSVGIAPEDTFSNVWEFIEKNGEEK